MRFLGRALIASAFVLGACAGGDTPDRGAAAGGTDTAAGAATGTPAGTAGAQPGTAGTQPGAPAGGAAAPATGTTHEVRMVLEGNAYKFVPENITIKQGDAIRFLGLSGGPHNVGFDPTKLPAGAEAALTTNLTEQGLGPKLGALEGPMVPDGKNYTLSFAGVPAGKYPYHCLPHLAMGMVGTINIQ